MVDITVEMRNGEIGFVNATLLARMKELRCTVEELTQETGILPVYFSRVKRCHHVPAYVRTRFAEALDVPEEELFPSSEHLRRLLKEAR